MSRTLSLAFLACAWLLGIAAAAASDGSAWAAVGAFGLLGAVAFAYRPGALTFALVLAAAPVILAASWRYEASVPELPPDSIARLNDTGGDVRFRGTVSDEPDSRETVRQYRLEVRGVRVDGRWRKASGGVLAQTPAFTTWEYGDLLEMEGRLKTPERLGDFDYREYLLRRGIVSIVSHPEVLVLSHGHGAAWREALISIRGRLSAALSDVLPEPEASLAGGILLGTRTAIPRELQDDMNATGTSHLVAVSGQNVTMLAALVIGALGALVGRRSACWLALVVICGYALLAGLQPSVFRAAIMGGLWVMSVALGRQNTAAVALLLAGAAMTVAEPQVVHEVSFQLSFASVLGLIVLTPVLNMELDRLTGQRGARGGFPGLQAARDVLTMTLASIAFTLPISAINFQQISLAAPLANLLAVPAFLAVALTSGLATALALVIPGDASWLAPIAWPAAAYMIAVIRLFAGLPGASVGIGGVHTWHAVVYYTLVAGTLYLASRRRIDLPTPAPRTEFAPSPGLLPTIGVALVLVLASAAVWLAALSPNDGRLSVTFLDVGQGDAILIKGPHGNRVLVDGGPSGEVVSDALGRNLPFYDRRIDLVVLTHPQADHLGGLPAVLDRFNVGGVLTTEFQASTELYQEWQNVLARSDLRRATAERGEWIDLGGGANLTVLNPAPETKAYSDDELNDTSIVLRLTMGGVSFLLTGDITEEAETALVHRGTELRATVLKLPHHGSATSSSPAFLGRVRPLIDVVSAGKNNPYGHPSPEVLARLNGDAVFRTDADGDITVSTDGERVWVETQR